jgi:hypothetical protein
MTARTGPLGPAALLIVGSVMVLAAFFAFPTSQTGAAATQKNQAPLTAQLDKVTQAAVTAEAALYRAAWSQVGSTPGSRSERDKHRQAAIAAADSLITLTEAAARDLQASPNDGGPNDEAKPLDTSLADFRPLVEVAQSSSGQADLAAVAAGAQRIGKAAEPIADRHRARPDEANQALATSASNIGKLAWTIIGATVLGMLAVFWAFAETGAGRTGFGEGSPRVPRPPAPDSPPPPMALPTTPDVATLAGSTSPTRREVPEGQETPKPLATAQPGLPVPPPEAPVPALQRPARSAPTPAAQGADLLFQLQPASSGHAGLALEAAEHRGLVLAAGSKGGLEHNAESEYREDAWAWAPTVKADAVIVAVADGVSRSRLSHAAALMAVEAMVKRLDWLDGRTITHFRQDQSTWQREALQALEAVAEEMAPATVQARAEALGWAAMSPASGRRGHDPATTLVLAAVAPSSTGLEVLWCGIGDSSICAVTDAGEVSWIPADAGRVSGPTPALPRHTPQMRAGGFSAARGSAVCLVTDGMEQVFRRAPELLPRLRPAGDGARQPSRSAAAAAGTSDRRTRRPDPGTRRLPPRHRSDPVT